MILVIDGKKWTDIRLDRLTNGNYALIGVSDGITDVIRVYGKSKAEAKADVFHRFGILE